MGKTLLALITALSLLSFGCNKKGDTGKTGAEAAAQAKTPSFFDYIPAETPYVFANLEEIPQVASDKIFKIMEPVFAFMNQQIDKALTDENTDKLGKALLEEFKGKLNKKGLEEMGFSTNPSFALYGLGVMPAFRITLKDAKVFKAMIERVEKKSGMKAPVKKLGEQEYWGGAEDGMEWAVALVGNELVAGMIPEKLSAELMPVLLGQKKLEKSIASANTLKELMINNNWRGYALGFIDTMGIAKTILGESKGLNAKVWGALPHGMGKLPPNCNDEIKAMVAKAPNLSFGYKQMSATVWAVEYLIALEPALAKELKGLSASVPGLGESKDVMFSLGLGLNVGKFIDWTKKTIEGMKAKPYQCMFFAEMNEGVKEAAEGLQMSKMMIPPFVNNIRGFNLVLKSADFKGDAPSNIKASLVISMEKADEAMAMIKQMAAKAMPPLAKLEIKTDAKPVALPAEAIPPMAAPMLEAPHIAMTKSGIALSIGKGEEAKLAKLLKVKAPSDPPFIAVNYDMSKFMGAVEGQLNAGMASMPPEMQTEQKKMMDMAQGIMKALGTISYSTHFSEKGILFKQQMNLN